MKRTVAFLLIWALLTFGAMGAWAEGVAIIGDSTDKSASYGGETELKPGAKIKVDGDYDIALSDPGARCFSREQDLSGQSAWGYLATKEDGSAKERIYGPVGTHTVLRVYAELTNRSRQETNWLKRVKCTVVYDERYEFETLAAQYNPNQTASDGATGMASIEAVPTEPLVKASLAFAVAVPYIVRDSDKPLWAYISVDGDTYAVDLREVMAIG